MRPAELIECVFGRSRVHPAHAVDTGQFLQDFLIVRERGPQDAGDDLGGCGLRIKDLIAADSASAASAMITAITTSSGKQAAANRIERFLNDRRRGRPSLRGRPAVRVTVNDRLPGDL